MFYNSASWTSLYLLKHTYHCFSRSGIWSSSCRVLRYMHLSLYRIFIWYWQTFSVPPYQQLMLSDFCFFSNLIGVKWHFIFYFYFLSSLLICEHFWLSVEWFACTCPLRIFLLLGCFLYCTVGGFFFFNVFKIFTNVSEVCLLVKFVCICVLKFPNFLNNDHYGPKLLWILHYSILLINFTVYFLKIRIYALLFLKLWGNVIYCKYILPKTI